MEGILPLHDWSLADSLDMMRQYAVQDKEGPYCTKGIASPVCNEAVIEQLGL